MEPKTDAAPVADAETYRCPGCGGTLIYDIKKKAFACSSCGNPAEVKRLKTTIEEYDFRGYEARERASAPIMGVITAKCENCGGEIQFSQYDTATRCPMCGSPSVRPAVAESGIPPEGVVPFRIDQYDAQELFRKWISKRWFAPNLLKKSYQEGALGGLYVPFWTYDADAHGDYVGRGGRQHTERDSKGNSHTVTDWYPVSGSVDESFDDLQVCASGTNGASLASDVSPFNTVSDLEPFTPVFLSGYKAERYSKSGLECFETARRTIENTLRSSARAQIRSHGYDTAEISSMSVTYSKITYKSVLVPIYAANYGYGGKTFSYAVNGETGRVAGSYPKSAIKIILFILLIAAIIGGVFYLAVRISDSGDTSGSNNDYNDYDNFDDYFYEEYRRDDGTETVSARIPSQIEFEKNYTL